MSSSNFPLCDESTGWAAVGRLTRGAEAAEIRGNIRVTNQLRYRKEALPHSIPPRATSQRSNRSAGEMFRPFPISSAIGRRGRRSPSSILRSVETEHPTRPSKLFTRKPRASRRLAKATRQT